MPDVFISYQRAERDAVWIIADIGELRVGHSSGSAWQTLRMSRAQAALARAAVTAPRQFENQREASS